MPSSTRVEVIVVTAHEMVREALLMALGTFEEVVIVGEAETEAQLLTLCARHQASILLLDWLLPQMDKVATLLAIYHQHPAIQMIILLDNEDELRSEVALPLGVRCFLRDKITLDMLEAALQALVTKA